MLETGRLNPQNMFRKCYRLHLPDPCSSTLGTICAQIMVTKQVIQRLSKGAPALQCQHLLDLIKDAKKHDDTICAKAILKILKREEQKKHWRQIIFSIHPSRGENPTAIQVQPPTGNMKYDTVETVFHNATEHLSHQFRLAYSALCYSSQILEDIGHLGDTQCAQEILEGIYAYPPDTDLWTMKILQEAHHTYKLLSNDSIDSTVSVYDFQDYWQGTNEAISSLFSHFYFGHYKAASFNNYLSALHATKLSACTRKEYH
jgi:hypothetical protein